MPLSERANLNLLSVEELVVTTRMSRECACALVEHRPFSSWEDLKRVPGVEATTIKTLWQAGARLHIIPLTWPAP